MRVIKGLPSIIAAFGLLTLPVPASAAMDPGAALKIRQLDIMLMVGALRCRHGADGYQPDYNRFSSNHLATLNEASNVLKTDLTARYGKKGAAKQLDRISTGMANQYGQGHPWLDCAALKKVTMDLAHEKQSMVMVDAARTLLANAPPQDGILLARK